MNIRAVAELAGVAPSTVSLALNKPREVAENTRESVFRAIQTLDYVPRPRGRPRKRLDSPAGTNRTNRVALIAAGEPSAVLQAPVYMNVLQGVESGLERHGMTMVLRRAPTVLRGTLLPTRVDGVLLFGDPEDPVVREELMKLPCVQMMGPVKTEGTCDHVSYDNSRIGKIAGDYLRARGHKHCAFIGEASRNATLGRERRANFQKTIEAGGGTVTLLTRESLYVKGSGVQTVHREALGALIDEMLRMKPRPTGIFVEADLLTSVAYSILYERRARPGPELDIVSCNNEQLLLQGLHPRPATVDIHAQDIGRRAVEQLLWRLEHLSDPRVSVALEPELVYGQAE